MSDSSDREKLRILLTHWVIHNDEHAEEFRRWGDRVEQWEDKAVASDLTAAVRGMAAVNEHLSAALERLGGPADHPH